MLNAAAPLDSTATIAGNLKAWAAQPFNSTMSLKGWALFTGLILILCVAWVMILRELEAQT